MTLLRGIAICGLAALLSACGGGGTTVADDGSGGGSGGGGGGGGTTPDPDLTFTAAPEAVALNDSTTLTWDAVDVATCEASGAWAGSRDLMGTEDVGPLDADSTFTMTCSGDDGSVVESVGVTVRIATLSWTISETVDALRLHYGTATGAYDTEVDLAGDATEFVLELAPGTYFFAMTAIADGTESDLSNEVQKTIL